MPTRASRTPEAEHQNKESEDTPRERTERMLEELDQAHLWFWRRSEHFAFPVEPNPPEGMLRAWIPLFRENCLVKQWTGKEKKELDVFLMRPGHEETDGKNMIEYVMTRDKGERDPSGFIDLNIPYQRMNLYAGQSGVGVSKIGNHLVHGIESDGIHISNRRQADWDVAWEAFYKKISADKRFKAFIDREIARGSKGRLFSPRVDNARRFVKETEELWNAVYETALVKKTFPVHDAPLALGDTRPPDTVMAHEDFQHELHNVTETLKRVFTAVDERLYREPTAGSPYR